MDREAVAASVRKTGRLVIVTEAVRRGSVASDIAAWVAENAFDALKGPIRIVAGRVTPIPYNPALESLCIPNAGDIAEAVRNTVLNG
jgi:pyruvate dehydrogenase E1 component beta subunit